MGCYPREVRRVGWRYLEGGLNKALTDNPRPKPDKMWNDKQQVAIVALACSTPPDGEMVDGEFGPRGRTAKHRPQCQQRNALKPWRKKNVVLAKLDQE